MQLFSTVFKLDCMVSVLSTHSKATRLLAGSISYQRVQQALALRLELVLWRLLPFVGKATVTPINATYLQI